MAQAKLYLPIEAENYERVSEEIRHRMAYHFGGFTAYEARGGWLNPQGDLIEEPVMVYETFDDNVTNLARHMDMAAGYVKSHTQEDSVMYTINHEPHFL